MTSITMVELRRNAESILRRVARGERFVLTYRGQSVAQLQPIQDKSDEDESDFYTLCGVATDAPSLSNAQIDDAIYGD